MLGTAGFGVAAGVGDAGAGDAGGVGGAGAAGGVGGAAGAAGAGGGVAAGASAVRGTADSGGRGFGSGSLAAPLPQISESLQALSFLWALPPKINMGTRKKKPLNRKIIFQTSILGVPY